MSLLALQALDGGCVAKRWTADGKVIDYSRVTWWRPIEARVSSLEGLHTALVRLSRRPDLCVVRGALIESGQDRILRRLKGEGASIRDADRQWICCDMDTTPTPAALLPLMGHRDGTEAAAGYLRGLLPAWLGAAGVVLQWSQSAGRDGWARLKAHLWFWLSRPVCCDSLSRWAKGCKIVDPATNRPVQPIYTADPIIEDGWLGRPSPSVTLFAGPPAVVPRAVLSLEDHGALVAREAAERAEKAAAVERAMKHTSAPARESQSRASMRRLAEHEARLILGAGEGGRHDAIVRAVKAVSALGRDLGVEAHGYLRIVADAGRAVLPANRQGEVEQVLRALGGA